MDKKVIKILGINFFDGSLQDSLEFAKKGGLVVAPSGPGLAQDLMAFPSYADALLNADVVIPDSGLMCLWQNFSGKGKLERISGFAFLKSYLEEFSAFDSSFWVMPNEKQDKSNRVWLNSKYGASISRDRVYIAPFYDRDVKIEDKELLLMVEKHKPETIFIQIGGGIQESLGNYLKEHLSYHPTILCTGAAIAFLSGEQASIPLWADRYYMGWLIRCICKPSIFIPRYLKAFRLVFLLFRFGRKFPV